MSPGNLDESGLPRHDASPPLSPPYDPGITSGPLRPAIFRLALPAVGAALAAPSYGLLGVWWILAITAMARAAAMTALWRWGGWQRARA